MNLNNKNKENNSSDYSNYYILLHIEHIHNNNTTHNYVTAHSSIHPVIIQKKLQSILTTE